MSVTLGVVVSDETPDEISKCIEGTDYENTSQFIRSAIREKLDRMKTVKSEPLDFA